ncbi:MAG: hypothetical protein J0I41_21130 [Filimonas sp.]|nr:hypothetical protein [Filimonas sp.]
MLQQGLHNSDLQTLSTIELCDFIENEYHNRIKQYCCNVQVFLEANPHIQDLPFSTAELFHLLTDKLCAELNSLLLKESGIVFPFIRQQAKTFPAQNCIEIKAADTIRIKQDIITMLLQKIRALFNNYTNQPAWTNQLKICVGELFNLEQTVLQWIHTEQYQLFPKFK